MMIAPSRPFCLVLDPSLTMRKILEVELRRNAYPFATFADPLPALQAMARQSIRPDIALIAWRLPRLNGIDTLISMRNAGYPTAVVVLLDQDQDRVLNHLKAKLAGAKGTLVKPFTMQQLHDQLLSLSSPLW